MLSIPSEVEVLAEAGQLVCAVMIQADLDEGSQGLWSEDYDVSVGGVTFKGIGGNIETDEFTGSGDLSVENFEFKISGLVPEARNIIDAMTWHQRPATVLIAFLNSARQVVHTMPRYSGFLDQATVSDQAGGTCLLTVVIENNNRELDRSSGRTRSDADQRSVGGATDGFAKYVAQANTDVQITWGKNGPKSPVS